MRLKFFLVFSGILLAVNCITYSAEAQGIPIGNWRSHLSYNDGLYLTEAGDKIWVAGRHGFYTVNKNDFTTERLSKVDGFSNVQARRIEYGSQQKAFFIAYQDAGIDIVKNNTIIPVNDLRNKNINTIYDFYFYNKYCYIAHNEGITEYNLEKMELAETYFDIGQPGCARIKIYGITVHNNFLYAATELGVQRGSLNGSILNSCSNWQSISNQPGQFIATFADKVWAVFPDKSLQYYDGNNWQVFDNGTDIITGLEVNHNKLVLARGTRIVLIDEQLNKQEVPSNQQNHAILDANAYIWLAKNAYSTLRLNPADNHLDFIAPNGPAYNESFRLHNWGNEMWVASGGIGETGSGLFRNSGFYSYINDEWKNYNQSSVSNWFSFKDVTDIETDPVTGKKWISSLDSGLIEFDAQNNLISNFYNAGNSALRNPNPAYTNAPVSALAFDGNNNLWMTNYRALKPLVVRTNKNRWYSFTLGSKNWATNLVADDYNNIWVIMPRQGAMYVFTPGQSIDAPNDGDQVKELTMASGNGALPSNNVFCIEKDKTGQIWIGTGDGVAVFAEPSLVFSPYKFDAQRPWVENGNQSGYLLAGEQVISLAVDGGNRKWLGTRNGAWLVSADGSSILQHFTTQNSPLISNIISDIEVNSVSGEVFFITDKGIISYRGTATEGGDKHGDVYAYPNPVKPGYDGSIAITGLVRDAKIKITDICGKIVYETTAEGGQAIWYGKNFNGDAAQSGVYLVFSASADGKETAVTKILIIR